jgi:tetraacyldisaccharide 4'-kinase
VAVGVVSRGYGRSGTDCVEVTARRPARANRRRAGPDPPAATGAPVFVAGKRAEALRALLAAHPETAVALCDDGLQHYALQRDIEIAAFDDRGAGNGWLLPAGPLREPWPAAQTPGPGPRAPHRRKNPPSRGSPPAGNWPTTPGRPAGHRVALAGLRGRPVTALAGIANPQAFFGMLRGPSAWRWRPPSPCPTTTLFSEADLAALARPDRAVHRKRRRQAVCPCLAAAGLDLLAVPLEFSPEPAFFAAFDALLAPRLSPLPSTHGHQIA